MSTDPTVVTHDNPAALLGALQLAVMRFAWALPYGEFTVKQAHEAINAQRADRGRPLPQLAYTTILTVMRNLRHRGFLAQNKTGHRADGFRILVSDNQYHERVVRFALAHCGGDREVIDDQLGRLGSADRAAAAMGIGA